MCCQKGGKRMNSVRFLQFVADILEKDVADISMDSSFNKGEWNSLMHIRLVAEISDEYDVDIPIDEVGNIHTLGDFYKYVENK